MIRCNLPRSNKKNRTPEDAAYIITECITPECVEWSADECNVRIARQENGKVKLSGEWLIWDEAAGNWKGVPMTRMN